MVILPDGSAEPKVKFQDVRVDGTFEIKDFVQRPPKALFEELANTRALTILKYNPVVSIQYLFRLPCVMRRRSFAMPV